MGEMFFYFFFSLGHFVYAGEKWHYFHYVKRLWGDGAWGPGKKPWNFGPGADKRKDPGMFSFKLQSVCRKYFHSAYRALPSPHLGIPDAGPSN